ncbi:hypothetical protein LJC63_10430, partial [Ruminococcaceae bacterium OttesenSCG-928-L11]|nr:hypothetical protein [Ruminococcaceae bacterium OttesenSCG-928-L11]
MNTYQSTCGNSPILSAEEALCAGFAPDGGCYVPVKPPRVFSTGDLAILAWLSHHRRLAHILERDFDGLSIDMLVACAEAAYGIDTLAEKAVPVRDCGAFSAVRLRDEQGKSTSDTILPRLIAATVEKPFLLSAVGPDTAASMACAFADAPVPGLLLYPEHPGIRLPASTPGGLRIQPVQASRSQLEQAVAALYRGDSSTET